MAIKYKVIEKGKPGVVGGGEKKFYASAVHNEELTLKDLTNLIEKESTLSRADIHGALISMVDAIQQSLAKGRIVRLGELGSLRINISSRGEDRADKVSASSIRGAKILFSAGKDLQKLTKSLDYKKKSDN